MHNHSRIKTFAPAMMTAGLLIALAACATASKPVAFLRQDTANHLAGRSHLIETHIPAGEFTIMAYERVANRGQSANIYIEDDGAEAADHSVKGDSTPIDPVALRMASDDMSPNVVYMARPCQFVNALNVRPCAKPLYTTHRYSPQILDAMNAALDNVKKNNGISSINLIGVGGGAAIAVELAAVRNDVVSLKFVGGVLDTRVMQPAASKDGPQPQDPYAGSLNPIDAAPRVASIPQTFTVAGWDKSRSLTMIKNFQAAEGNPAAASIVTDGPDPDAPPVRSQTPDENMR